MNTDASGYRELKNEADRLLNYHKTTRQFFKHLKDTDIEKISLKHGLFSLKNKVTATLRFSRKIDRETIDEMNSVAHYLNQNVIVRFCALLEKHKVIGANMKICKEIEGSEDLNILRELRNCFAHSSGNLKSGKHEKLCNKLKKRFELTEKDHEPNEFPLPSTQVIGELFNSCLSYSEKCLQLKSEGKGYLFEKENSKTFNKSWDWHIDSDHSIEGIDLEKVGRFVDSANKNRDKEIKDDPRQVLRKFELVRDNKVTNAGFLLFSKDDSALSTIELARIQDNHIIKDGLTLKSDLLSEVEAVMSYIKKQINKAYIFTGEIQRVERWDYPLDAVREIVVNAIVHRDYRESSDSIIKIYDTRIEFFNPGKLPEGMDVEILLSGDYVSNIRNKKIAEIFKEANMIEKYGSGIRRILEGFKAHGLPEPVFEEVGNGFRVTIYKNESPDIPSTGSKNTLQRNIGAPK